MITCFSRVSLSASCSVAPIDAQDCSSLLFCHTFKVQQFAWCAMVKVLLGASAAAALRCAKGPDFGVLKEQPVMTAGSPLCPGHSQPCQLPWPIVGPFVKSAPSGASISVGLTAAVAAR